MLGQILASFLTILVGVNLVPSIANTVYGVHCNWNGSTCLSTNVTGASAAIVTLIPLFFVLGIVITTIQSSIAVLAKMGF